MCAGLGGDAAVLPFRRRAFDACLSQEGLLHIADKAAVLAECHRVLVPGGRLAFTDWIARPRLTDAERERLHAWMAATTLQSLASYRTLLGGAGFGAIEAEEYDRLFAFFVALVEAGKLGGGRFSGTA